MHLRHLQTIHSPSGMVDGQFQKITAICWSPNSYRLAVATADRYIILYDENGEQQDKFSTKPADKKGARNYIVRALEFSPDSTKLAIAQSDSIVFVYKLGAAWGDKKTICNKFLQSSPVTAMTWPSQRYNEVVFGLADGKMRIGILKNNKSATLFNTDSYVVSCAASPNGQSFISGHMDGSIYRYTFPDANNGPTQAMLVQTSFVPYSLGWGEHICVAGNTGVVQFLDQQGGQVQQFDYSGDPKVKEFTVASFNPSGGQTVVLGNYDKFFVYVYNVAREVWEETGTTEVKNLYTVTAVRWKQDGSRLVTGSLCGAVDTYDACVRRYLYMGKYEFTYTSFSSVIVKRLSSGERMALKSRFEIKKINIYSDRYLVAQTPKTLIMGDLKTTLLSEVPWNGSGKEKFYFDNPVACMVFNAGELSLIEYGRNEVLGSCRTEHMNPHHISLRLNEARGKDTNVKKIAFLLDLQAIRVLDLNTGVAEATVNHDTKIDWLELNQRTTKLLFRDKRRALHLVDLATQTRTTLLNFCNYVQWVPDSDVVVAQSRRNLCVYYSIDNPDEVTITPIKGDVEEIERTQGRTEVIVDEGINTAAYALDETLIGFGNAIDGGDYRAAVLILERMNNVSQSSDALWQQLSKLALENGNYAIAERCAAALGDVAKTNFLHEINEVMAQPGGGPDHFMVRAKIAILNRQFKRAEAILLQQGKVNEAIDMYRNLHKWDEALLVAESKNHPDVGHLRQEYYNYLLRSKQEEIAGELKEKEGDYMTALQLYLEGGFPSKAASLVLKQRITDDSALLERVADALVKARAYEQAGDFLENLKLYKRALEAYCRGHAYFRAVDLARHAFPGQVVRLEEEWGDYLVSQKQMDAASNHYIQAGAYLKAINAAIEARQWTKAVQILDQIEPGMAKPFYKRIAHHYAEVKNYADAERYFIQGDLPQEAVQMYTGAGEWDKAHQIASTYMPEEEISMLYVNQAQLMESRGKFKEAERLYLTVNEPDLAINMHKKNRNYDDMISLVQQHRADVLNETHLHLAHQFENEGSFKLAEKHYIDAKDWKRAVSMYRENDMWEDTLRVAKSYGGMNAYKQVAYAFAVSVGGDAGVKILAKRDLGELAVDYAIERGEFTEAFHIAEKSCKHKLPEVHLQYAMALEDEGSFDRAEEEFLKAKKPKEAVDMFIHQQDWDAAMRVANAHDPSVIPDIYVGRGRVAAEQKNFSQAESFFLQAKRPQNAIMMYKVDGHWDEAIRLAKQFVPRMVPELQADQLASMQGSAAQGGAGAQGDFLVSQAKLLEAQKNYDRAIDAYLKITTEHTHDRAVLTQCWQSAANLSVEYVPPRAKEVTLVIAKRLINIDRHDEAADAFLNIDLVKEAIDVYIQARMFDKARAVAQGNAPQFLSYVEKAHEDDLIRNDQIGDLGDLNPEVAVEMYAKRGDWDQVYELASKQGEAVVAKYATLHAKSLVDQGRYRQALHVFSERGVSPVPSNYALYKRIAQEILGGAQSKGVQDGGNGGKAGEDTAMELRDVLYGIYKEVSVTDAHSETTHEFERLLTIAHLQAMRITCRSMGLGKLDAKQAVSLLRYTKDVPVDRAFHDAGVACRDQDQLNMAFVFFNRFVDLTDLIEDPDSGDIDNSDFIDTDIPSPFEVPLPQVSSVSEDELEEIRDWVLEKAVSNDVGQTLSVRTCEKCNKETYEGSLTCHHCQTESVPCIVTGYPVQRGNKVKCKSCNRLANKSDWNKYVAKLKCCPWCGVSENPVY